MARRQDENQYGGPTGYTGFDSYFNTNAQSANRAAQGLATDTQNAAGKAFSGLENEYGAFKQQVDKAANKPGQYAGPTAFDPSAALQQQYADLHTKMNALGSEGGVQASLGKKATGMDAALTRRAGGDDFQRLRKQYAAFDNYLGEATNAGREYADGAENRAFARTAAKDRQFGRLRADTLDIQQRRDAEAERQYYANKEAEQAYYDALRQQEAQQDSSGDFSYEEDI